jgi:hypothetical protein
MIAEKWTAVLGNDHAQMKKRVHIAQINRVGW